MKYIRVIAIVVVGVCARDGSRGLDKKDQLLGVEKSFNGGPLRSDWKVPEQLEAEELAFTKASESLRHKSDESGASKRAT
jgi:hypothetical protein